MDTTIVTIEIMITHVAETDTVMITIILIMVIKEITIATGIIITITIEIRIATTPMIEVTSLNKTQNKTTTTINKYYYKLIGKQTDT